MSDVDDKKPSYALCYLQNFSAFHRFVSPLVCVKLLPITNLFSDNLQKKRFKTIDSREQKTNVVSHVKPSSPSGRETLSYGSKIC